MKILSKSDDIYANDLKSSAYSILYNAINGCEKYMLDNLGYIVSIQEMSGNISGYTEEELKGKHFSLFYSPEDRAYQKPERYLREALRKGEIDVSDIRYKRNGQAFCAWMKTTALYNHKGESLGFQLIVRDLTYKIIYEDLFHRVKKKYQNVFENQFFENRLVGIFKVSLKEFKILRANAKALAMCGIADIQDFSFNDFFVDKNERRKFISEIQKNIFLDKYHFQARKANDGTNIWLSITCLVKKNEGFLEGIIVDISENKKQFDKLRKVNKDLRKVNNELDQFIYHASHDLRSPLSTILGLISLIRMEKSPDLTEKYVNLIEERVNKLDSLIKDLLAISQNDRHEVKIEKINLNHEIKLILKDYYYQESYKQTDVFLNVKQNADFYTDAVRLRIILNNLISNAIKYRNTQRVDSYIRIDAEINEKTASIRIEDNGIGIEKKYLGKIFKMFFRATELSKGSGLGLYIVKSSLDRLGGKIQVASIFGEGTAFNLELPNKS